MTQLITKQQRIVDNVSTRICFSCLIPSMADAFCYFSRSKAHCNRLADVGWVFYDIFRSSAINSDPPSASNWSPCCVFRYADDGIMWNFVTESQQNWKAKAPRKRKQKTGEADTIEFALTLLNECQGWRSRMENSQLHHRESRVEFLESDKLPRRHTHNCKQRHMTTNASRTASTSFSKFSSLITPNALGNRST